MVIYGNKLKLGFIHTPVGIPYIKHTEMCPDQGIYFGLQFQNRAYNLK